MQSLTPEQFSDYLAVLDPFMAMAVCYESGDVALMTDVSGVKLLVRHKAVDGITKKGRFRCVRLKVSVRAAFRILAMVRPATEDIRITRPKNDGMVWEPNYDRAKLGRVGGFSRITLQGARLSA